MGSWQVRSRRAVQQSQGLDYSGVKFMRRRSAFQRGSECARSALHRSLDRSVDLCFLLPAGTRYGAERHRRIDFRCAKRRDVRGQERRGEQDQRGRDQHDRFDGVHSVQETLEQLPGAQGQQQTDTNTNGRDTALFDSIPWLTDHRASAVFLSPRGGVRKEEGLKFA